MKLINTLIASTLIAGTSLVSAQVQWLDESATDLRANTLESNLRSVPASLHQESASINFAWGADQATQGRPASAGPTELGSDRPVAESRQYWVDSNGAALARGVELPISAPGAVIRISALESGSRISLDPARLKLAMNGQGVSADFGPAEITTGKDMRSQGMRVPEDSLAFRLGREASSGTLSVALEGVPSAQALVIHVHEPNSPWVARLALPRQNFLSGQSLDFDLGLGNGRQQLSVGSVQAVLASPDATQTWPLQQARDGSLSLAAAPIAARSMPGSGLYEAHVYLESQVNGLTIRRDLTLALNIAPAIARFNGQANLARSSGLGLDLGIETAMGGRFQVNAEVLGTNAMGQLEPLGYVQSAAELEAGSGTIGLEIDPGMLRASGLSAPFEVHNLALLDQGRMYLLEQRARALRIER